MQESYGEGPASHPDPESCGSGRKASAEALTGAHAGQPSSCDSHRPSAGTEPMPATVPRLAPPYPRYAIGRVDASWPTWSASSPTTSWPRYATYGRWTPPNGLVHRRS